MAREFKASAADKRFANLAKQVEILKTTIRVMAERINTLEKWQAEDNAAFCAAFIYGKKRRRSLVNAAKILSADEVPIRIGTARIASRYADGRGQGTIPLGGGKYWVNGAMRQVDREV